MRAKEIFEHVEDSSIRKSSKDALPPSMYLPDVSSNYKYYRLLISLAGYPSHESPEKSIMNVAPLVVPYTKEECEMVKELLKDMKQSPYHLSKTPSKELDSVNKESPVRKFKDYK